MTGALRKTVRAVKACRMQAFMPGGLCRCAAVVAACRKRLQFGGEDADTDDDDDLSWSESEDCGCCGSDTDFDSDTVDEDEHTESAF
jgi:hypothetical protein